MSKQTITGHADLLIVCGAWAILLDWKSGHSLRRSPHHQRQTYALAVFDRYPEVQRIACYFPRLREREPTTVVWIARDRASWREGDYHTTGEEYRERLRELVSAPLQYTTGDHCVHCPRMLECPKRGAWVAQQLEIAKLPIVKDTRNAEHEDLIELQRRGRAIQTIGERMAKVVKDHVEAFGPLHGTSSVLAFRDYDASIDVEKAEPILRGLVGDRFGECVETQYKILKGKALDIVGSLAPHGEKGKAKAAAEEALREAGAFTTAKKLMEVGR